MACSREPATPQPRSRRPAPASRSRVSPATPAWHRRATGSGRRTWSAGCRPAAPFRGDTRRRRCRATWRFRCKRRSRALPRDCSRSFPKRTRARRRRRFRAAVRRSSSCCRRRRRCAPAWESPRRSCSIRCVAIPTWRRSSTACAGRMPRSSPRSHPAWRRRSGWRGAWTSARPSITASTGAARAPSTPSSSSRSRR